MTTQSQNMQTFPPMPVLQETARLSAENLRRAPVNDAMRRPTTGQQRHCQSMTSVPRGRGVAGGPHYIMGGTPGVSGHIQPRSNRKRRIADMQLPPQIRELVPESQAYMDLLSFEKKLDTTIARKRLEIQEAIKKPIKTKRTLRIIVSNTFHPGREAQTAGESSNDMGTVPSWELRVEGRLMEPIAATQTDGSDPHQHQSSRFPKRKFSSFFKSLVIELDKDIYGPDNHLVEWHRRPDTSETDGFQVKRPGDRNVKCTILLLLDYQPIKYKLDTRLARLLGIHTDTRARIIEALWQYVKTHKLQDGTEKDYINCDIYLKQIFGCERMRFMEIPQKLPNLLLPPDPIVITHLISVEGELKKAALYDIEVELDDPIKTQMSQFLSSQQNHNDIMTADDKISRTVGDIEEYKLRREFFLGFSQKPLEFIERWLVSQHNDLKAMTDTVGQTLEERQAAFYGQSWIPEAVSRHFYRQISARKAELDARLNVRNN